MTIPGEYNPAELKMFSQGCWTMVVEKLACVDDVVLEVLSYEACNAEVVKHLFDGFHTKMLIVQFKPVLE